MTIYGIATASPAARVSTISFRVAGWASAHVVAAVEEATNFGFRWGAFYSERLVKDLLGLDDDGVVRVSLVHYNSGGFSLISFLFRFFILFFIFYFSFPLLFQSVMYISITCMFISSNFFLRGLRRQAKEKKKGR